MQDIYSAPKTLELRKEANETKSFDRGTGKHINRDRDNGHFDCGRRNQLEGRRQIH